jgi:hypothetical protein
MNPMEALTSLQDAINNGMPLRRCVVSPELQIHIDQPDGHFRFTFVKLEQGAIKAYTSFIITRPVRGIPCITFTFAVPPQYRMQGLATEIIARGIHEMRYELQGFQVKKFFIEATIAADNRAANKIAEELIPTKPKNITDETSGAKAFQYLACVSCL